MFDQWNRCKSVTSMIRAGGGTMNHVRFMAMYPTWYMVVNKGGCMYYVYILLMSNGQLYAGFTHDLKRRMQEHQNGGTFTTSKYLPIQLIFYESFLRKTDAERREKYFKTSKGKSTLQLMLKDTLRK